MSLSARTKTASDGRKGPALSAGFLSLPSRRASPLAAVTTRMLLAVGLLALATVIVYLGRHTSSRRCGTGLTRAFALYPSVLDAMTGDEHWHAAVASDGYDAGEWCRRHGLP